MIPFLGIAMLTLGQANAPLRFEATKGEDWRVVGMPFGSKLEAEKARALLVSRGMRVEVVAF